MRRVLLTLLSALFFSVSAVSSPAVAATALTEAEAQNVVDSVRSTLTALAYDSTEVAGKIAPTRFSAMDKVNKRKEIAAATGRTFLQVTEQEAIAALQKDYVASAGYAQAFENVQQNLDTYLTSMIVSDSSSVGGGRNAQEYEQLITAKAAELLLGMAYIQRLYDFDTGDFNFAQGLRTSGAFGKDFSPIDLAISIGSQKGDDYAMAKNITTFNRLIAGVATDQTTLHGFITSKVPPAQADDWFTQQLRSHGNVVSENASAQIADGVYRLYSKMVHSTKYQPYMLPLLARENNAMYVISNVSSISWGMCEGYVADSSNAADMQAFEKTVAQYGRNQAEYIDFWARMVPEKKSTLKTERIATDGFFVAGRGSGKQGWSPSLGSTAAEAVKDFFSPMKLWFDYNFIGAEASGEDIRFWTARILAPSGHSAYTHELTHQLAQNGQHTYLNGYRHRSGSSTELLPRGLYETYEYNDPIYTLNQINDWSADGYANSSVNRFTDEKSVQTYVKNLLDVTNTLDLLEAQDVLSRDASVKQKWFNVVSLTPNSTAGKFDETFTTSTAQQAGAWTSVDDLVDANAVVSRYEAVGTTNTGTAKYNGYHTVPLFSPLFGAPLADNGTTGDIHMRRIAWELLGEYGFTSGWVPYLSDQYKPASTAVGTAFADAEVIKKISPYSSDAELRKAMYQQRADKLDQLKPVDISYDGQTLKIENIAKLRQLMKEAIDKDLASPKPARATQTNVEKLKSAIYLGYKAQTNEFADSIYAPAPTYTVTYRIDGEDQPASAPAAPTDSSKYVTGDKVELKPVPATSETMHNGVKGTWQFNGWLLDGQRVAGEIAIEDKNVTLTGSWSFTPDPNTPIGDKPADKVDVQLGEVTDSSAADAKNCQTHTVKQLQKETTVTTPYIWSASAQKWVLDTKNARTETRTVPAADRNMTDGEMRACATKPQPQVVKGEWKDGVDKSDWDYSGKTVTQYRDVTTTDWTWDTAKHTYVLDSAHSVVKHETRTRAMTSAEVKDGTAKPEVTTAVTYSEWAVTAKNCDTRKVSEKRTITTAVTDWTWDDATLAWVTAQPVVTTSAEVRERAMSEVEQAECPAAPEPPVVPDPETPPTVIEDLIAPTSNVVGKASDPASCTISPYLTIKEREGVNYALAVDGKDVPVTFTDGVMRYEYPYGSTAVVTAEVAQGYKLADGVVTKWTWTAPTREALKCDIPGAPEQGDTPEPTPGSNVPSSNVPSSNVPGANTPQPSLPSQGKKDGKVIASALPRTGNSAMLNFAALSLLVLISGAMLARVRAGKGVAE